MDLKENARIKEAVNKPSHYIGDKGLEVKEVLENFVKKKAEWKLTVGVVQLNIYYDMQKKMVWKI